MAGAGTMPPRRAAGATEPRWLHRPALAATLRVLVLVAPFAASLVTAWLVARILGTPEGVLERVLWWAGVLTASLGALLVFDRAARRLLPLAALLELSLIFPDRAPSRFGVALRSGSTKKLHAREVEALRRGDQQPAEAARTILTLAASLSTHDRDTRGHSERVRAYADLIGAEMGLDDDDRDRLRWAALLHDVGKVTVPTHTLHAPGALAEEDWDALRRHPLEGARLVEPLRDWLGPWALAIEQHHERFDGTGYPYGLRGDELSLAARIVAVADSYDAMTSARSYARPMSSADARQELAAQAGAHFDPAVVRAFLSISLGRLRWVMGPLAFLAAVPFALPLGSLRRGVESAGRTVALGTASLIATVSVVQPSVVAGPAAAPAPASPAPVVRPTLQPAAGPPAEPAPALVAPPPAVPEALPPPTSPSSPPAAAPARTPAAATPVTPPVASTVAPVPVPVPAPVPPATTAVPPAPPEVECREAVSDKSRRPCQPPRWGHTAEGNPEPSRD